MRSLLLIIFSLVAYQNGVRATCFAPHMPGPASCGECTGSDQLQGSQCVVEGRWFACYDTVDACCNDSEVKNNIDHGTCIQNYNDKKGSHYNGDPTVADKVYCDRVVAKVGSDTESCQTLCKSILEGKTAPLENSSFRQKCQYDHYEIKDNRIHFVTNTGSGPKVSPSGSGVTDGDKTETCFDHWVYGYSEPEELSGYKIFQNVSSPALCQIKCQKDPECVRFTYTGSTQGASEGQDTNYQCSLKNQAQVTVPLNIAYTSVENPANYDSNYCNYGMAHECWTDHYVCLPCQGTKRCVWASDYHVNGFRTCDHPTYCSIAPNTSTNSPPSPTGLPPSPTGLPPSPPSPTDPPAIETTTEFNNNTDTGDCVPPDCVRPCGCIGCACDNYGKVFLRVADRPKFLQLQLRN